MLGLIDLFNLFGRNIKPDNYRQHSPIVYYTDIHNRIHNSDEKRDIWFYFVPYAIEEHGFLKRSYFADKNSNIYCYETDSTYLIKPNPNETASLLEEICQDASESIERKLGEGNEINILGISLGNSIALKLASVYPCNNLVSVVGGARLWECIKDSLYTKSIFNKSGFSEEDYKNALEKFNAIDYLDKINAKNIHIFLGGFDKVVRFKHGKELAEKFKSKSKNVNIKIYKIMDHCSTMYFAGKDLASSLFNNG